MQEGGGWRRTEEEKWWAGIIEKRASVSRGGMFAMKEVGAELEGDRVGNWVRGGRTVAWRLGEESGVGRVRAQSDSAVVVERWRGTAFMGRRGAPAAVMKGASAKTYHLNYCQTVMYLYRLSHDAATANTLCAIRIHNVGFFAMESSC